MQPDKVQRFLVIQTAFIGDVILATSVVETLHKAFPEARIDFLLRKGNESLLSNHPFLNQVLVWDKKKGKLMNLLRMTQQVRAQHYNYVINLHRYASTGLITAFSGAKSIGFNKNPWSFAFTHRLKHSMNAGVHEVDRNHELLSFITSNPRELPRLYPSSSDFELVKKYQAGQYICVAPTSVWFTKQLPADQWIDLIKSISGKVSAIYLLGAPGDKKICEEIKNESGIKSVVNLAGELSFLQSAALIQGAIMNYVNDSAPMHLASATNAPVTAVYCSTVPRFGFGPLSTASYIVETSESLPCRPCGSHGHKACPLKHFKCATTITTSALQATLAR